MGVHSHVCSERPLLLDSVSAGACSLTGSLYGLSHSQRPAQLGPVVRSFFSSQRKSVLKGKQLLASTCPFRESISSPFRESFCPFTCGTHLVSRPGRRGSGVIPVWSFARRDRRKPPKNKLPAQEKALEASNGAAAAPRITGNVKNSLEFVKLLKSDSGNGETQKAATRFRRKKVTRDGLPPEIGEPEDPTTRLYHTSAWEQVRPPVLLVDGYNVCGYWPKLKKLFSRGDLHSARVKLVQELTVFAQVREVKVVVVFDAAASGFASHRERFGDVDVVYAADGTADSFIEREVTLLQKSGCSQVWVATSDHVQGLTALGSGAYVWSCSMLISEMKEAKEEMEELFEEDNPYSWDGKLLEHNLDKETVQGLKALKKKLLALEK